MTRPKKNIARDFSDGVLLAEIVNYFLPKYIDVLFYNTKNNRFIIIVKQIQLNKKNIIGKRLILKFSRKWDFNYQGIRKFLKLNRE